MGMCISRQLDVGDWEPTDLCNVNIAAADASGSLISDYYCWDSSVMKGLIGVCPWCVCFALVSVELRLPTLTGFTVITLRINHLQSFC